VFRDVDCTIKNKVCLGGYGQSCAGHETRGWGKCEGGQWGKGIQSQFQLGLCFIGVYSIHDLTTRFIIPKDISFYPIPIPDCNTSITFSPILTQIYDKVTSPNYRKISTSISLAHQLGKLTRSTLQLNSSNASKTSNPIPSNTSLSSP
jgi:hypothetical protein